MWLCVYIYIRAYMNMIRVDLKTCMYVCMYVCMYIYMCICIRVYVYTYIYMYMMTLKSISYIVYVCIEINI